MMTGTKGSGSGVFSWNDPPVTIVQGKRGRGSNNSTLSPDPLGGMWM